MPLRPRDLSVALTLVGLLAACGQQSDPATVPVTAQVRTDPQGGTDGRPNILLIVADDLGYTDLGAYGGEIKTPNIDALAAEGLLFTQFHTGPQCAVTRAMLLSGNSRHLVGAGAPYLSERIAPLPSVLRSAGYRTYMAGKWHLGGAPDRTPTAAGFERSFALIPGAANHFSATGANGNTLLHLADGAEAEYPEGEYSTDVYTDRLIEFLDAGRDSGQPFFALAAYTAPHWPLQVPDEYRDLYAGVYDEGYGALRQARFDAAQRVGVVPRWASLPPRDPVVPTWASLSEIARKREAREMELYAAMVENLDDHVGRLVEYLRVNGMYERTLIAFMSDNGANARDQFATGDSVDNSLDNLGAATSWVAPGPEWAEASTAPFSRYKQYTRQGGIVSPLIVSGPGVTARGSMDRSFVTVMDLAPTFIDLAGASYPTEDSIVPMRGESVLGLLRGEQSHVHDDEYTTVLMHAGRALVRQGDWKLVTLEGPFDESKFELFNVASDPGETTNLAPDHPDRFEAMLGLWRTERRELGIVLPGDP